MMKEEREAGFALRKDKRDMKHLTLVGFPRGFPHLILFSLLLSLFSFIACQNPHSSPEQETALPANSGSFSLAIAGADARTILPDAPELSDFAVYELAFTATGGGTNLTTDRTNATYTDPIILVEGTYGLTVSAYGDASKMQLMARGSIAGIVITAGSNTPGSVVLKALLGETGTSGDFSWNTSLPAGTIAVTSATMTIKDSGGTTVGAVEQLQTTPAGSRTGLPSGMYTVVFNIEGTDSGGEKKSAILNEFLYIYAELTSRFPSSGTFAFSDALFHKTYWNITFDENHSAGNTGTQSVEHGGAYLAPAAPTRSGYTFAEWNTASDGTGISYNSGDSISAVTADMTLYAQWDLITYTVTFNSNGGTSKTPITGILPGSTIALPTAPTRTNFVFAGWFTDDGTFANAFNATTVVTGDITVFAKWTCTVTFNSNSGSAVTAKTGILPGTTITLPADPTKPHYTFLGWFTDDKTFAVPFTSSTPVTAGITVYAQWEIEPGCIEVTIDMFDSAGDGWDGSGALEIYINGTKLPVNARLSSGSSGTYTFAVILNDMVEFYWHGTSYVTENSFIVYYTDEPPSPAFTSSNNGTWNGANALFYKLKGSLTNADNGKKIGEFDTLPRPKITAQPVGRFYFFGVDTIAAPLTITAVPADANPLSYQWYSNTADSTSGGTLLAGAVGTSYTPDISVEGTAYYYCVVTNTGTGDTKTSAVVRIRVGTGDGSAGAPWPINSGADLQLIGTDDANGWGLNDHYKLTGDVTLTAPWTPIGTSSNGFTGSFDGGGHTISGMEISAGTGNRAMFVTIDSGGVVKNLGLLDVNIESSNDAGAIAGNLYDGLIENCFATGTVSSTTTSKSVGGLVGWGGSSAGIVKNSYFIGTVEGGGSGAYVGGIYGFANSGHVENCYAAGVVGPGGSARTGGIVGDTAGTIKNSVALSDLKLFSGTTAYRISDTGVTNCYARDDLTITVGSNAPVQGTAGTSANTANGADVSTTAPNGGYNVQAFWETTMGWDFTSIWEMGTVTITINGTPTPMALPVLRAP